MRQTLYTRIKTFLLDTPVPFSYLLSVPWKSTPLVIRDKLYTNQYHSLLLVESAFRGDANAAELFNAYYPENRGPYRRTLKIFAKRLQNGLPLIDALEQTPDVLDPNCVAAIRHGLSTGTLSETFEMLKAESAHRRISANNDKSTLGFYWLVIGAIILVILTYISYRILPTFGKVALEYDLPQNDSIAFLKSFADQLLFFLPWLVLGIILLSMTGLLSIFRAFFRRRILPLFTFTKDLLSSASILRLLALQLQANNSLRNSLSILAKYHHRKSVRTKMLLARNEFELGKNTWHCLAEAGILSQAECRVIADETKSESQAWILQKLADLRDHRANVIVDRFLVVLSPALAIFWGIIVLWTSTVVFFSLIRMVVSVS